LLSLFRFALPPTLDWSRSKNELVENFEFVSQRTETDPAEGMQMEAQMDTKKDVWASVDAPDETRNEGAHASNLRTRHALFKLKKTIGNHILIHNGVL